MIPRLLVGTTVYNTHARHMLQSLHDAGMLYRYVTGGVDSFRGTIGSSARRFVSKRLPALHRQLSRRAVTEIPQDLIETRWRWELPRVLTGRLGWLRIEDWIWEQGEFALDADCAARLRDPQVGGFLGVEHGALESLRAARALGKPGIVVFLSAHHRTRETWVDREFDKFPEMRTPGQKAVHRLSAKRDARRDEEAATADWIRTGSRFITRSLIEGGFPARKILTVPLAGPEPVNESRLRPKSADVLRFVFAGTVAIHKGAHYLLRVWPRVAGSGTELHMYGKVMLPETTVAAAKAQPVCPPIFHGNVPRAVLAEAYLDSHVLVMPTLCDGFGVVVSEAMAHGLPVITTTNAGAADLVQDGVTGFVIPPADEAALEDRLQWCIDHPCEVIEMGRAAHAAAGRWTWADFRRRHSEVLWRALNS